MGSKQSCAMFARTSPVLVLCWLLFGCASTDAMDHARVLSQKSISARSYAQAIAVTSALPLAPGNKRSRQITLDSPTIEMDGRRSLYELYSVAGIPGKAFQVDVWSYCDCFGFDKTILDPVVVVLTKDGRVLATSAVSKDNPPAGLTALNRQLTVKGAFESESAHYILLLGDTANVGSATAETGSVTSYAAGASAGYMVTIGSIAVTKSPVGKIAIQITDQ